MPEIGLCNRSALAISDLAFIARAVAQQMEKDFAPAWKVEPWPVVEYQTPPASGVYPIFVLDDIGYPDALGFHDDQYGAIYGRVLVQDLNGTCETASHEALELRADPDCQQWKPMGDGRDVAVEVADPVEEDSYPIQVTLFGQTRTVLVSNFILPAWFDPKSSGPWDFMGRLTGPLTMTPGGYMLVRDKAGNVSSVFASNVSASHLAKMARKYRDPMSRTYRRLLRAA